MIEGHSKQLVKKALTDLAMEKYRLSYVVPGFADPDRWDLKTYTMQQDDFGRMYIEDDDTKMSVVKYDGPVKFWFEYNAFSRWERFIPEEVYGEWLIGTSSKWKGVAGGGWRE